MIDETKLTGMLWRLHEEILTNSDAYEDVDELCTFICRVVSIIDEFPKEEHNRPSASATGGNILLNATEEDVVKAGKGLNSLLNGEGGILFSEKVAEDVLMGLKALKRLVPETPNFATTVLDGKEAVGKIGICPECGSVVDDIMIWCDECGKKLM